MSETLQQRLRIRAKIRRQAKGRKSVAEGQPDRLADLLDEAAERLDILETGKMNPCGCDNQFDCDGKPNCPLEPL